MTVEYNHSVQAEVIDVEIELSELRQIQLQLKLDQLSQEELDLLLSLNCNDLEDVMYWYYFMNYDVDVVLDVLVSKSCWLNEN